jgi:hypothetical protein
MFSFATRSDSVRVLSAGKASAAVGSERFNQGPRLIIDRSEYERAEQQPIDVTQRDNATPAELEQRKKICCAT